MIAERISHYRIRSQLGAGGMGEVYLAEDTRLDRKVALKLLPDKFTQDADRVRRFMQEAKAASALNHPNIITIYEIGQEQGAHYIATEFIDGQTLRQRLTGEGLLLDAALEVGAQTASALAAAHEAGIIHRDIKPENVMLRRDGYVKVLDFGLAKLTERRPDKVDTDAPTFANVKTDPGTIMGTAQYMSPEQARGQEVDARSDIFSLGVMLYEMVAGRAPFEGASATDVLAAILKTEPALLASRVPGAPPELERIVAKALRKDREERYQTVKDLQLDLKSLKQELEIEGRLKGAQAPLTQPPMGEVATNEAAAVRSTSSAEYLVSGIKCHPRSFAVALIVLLLAVLGISYWLFARRLVNITQIESIAVLPFQNASGNAEVEYLSDGITESLINSLSQLSKLTVKARSSVFRYKGKEVEPQQAAAELGVQAVLNGRVVQRGDDLTLYLSLVDGRNGNQLWGEQYNKKLTDLVSLQSAIARDVSEQLRVRWSGTDEQKLAKNYTANAEAYQLYLRGRYHVFKLTPPEIQKGISYFRQAIDLDPNYALAYVGLSDAHRSLALSAEMLPTDVFPKARAAVNKAIEIDDRLSEAHSTIGMNLFWYDWDWNAAENQFKRALELNPNNSDAHLFYAHLCSNLGRHAEALVGVKRARELDPLSPFVNSLEAQFLNHAGRPDEALDRLQKAFELSPNFWMAHLFAASVYTEKGMYDEAIAEARKVRELSPIQTFGLSHGGYALARSGKRDEARAALNELLKLSTERYVPPTHMALLHNALGEREEALAWLERGLEQHDPKLTFLKVEPKWNNLRAEPRFQAVLRKVGLAP